MKHRKTWTVVMTEVEGKEAGWLQCIANRVVRGKVIGWEMTHRGHETRRDISIMKAKKRRSKKRSSLILKTSRQWKCHQLKTEFNHSITSDAYRRQSYRVPEQ